MSFTIITNNVPRDVVEAYELPADARAEFDYIDWNAVENGEESGSFARYKGTWYDLNDLEGSGSNIAGNPFDGWDAYQSDTFFSGILVRYADEHFESVVFGRYYC
jgi:hypothetical protein